MRLLFAGTPDFSVAPLHALIAKKHDIVAVYTQPDRPSGRGKTVTPPPVKKAALAHNIDVFQPLTLKEDAHTQNIEQLQPDVMVVVAYGMLLPPSILSIPKYGCINIHASLLPRWRGAAPIQRAIEAGDKQSGISIMQMETGLDTGPVFSTVRTDITSNDTTQSLHDRLSELGAKAICDTLEQIEKGSANAVAQNDAKANYAKKINKQESQIDWSLSAQQIDNKIRAFIPWPICQTTHHGNRLRITSAVTHTEHVTHKAQSGAILNIDERGIEISCGQGTLYLTKLQRDGGKKLNHTQLLNGYSMNIGDILA